ncbi:MAG: hypothetical protein HKP37_09720 [Boseongicola sp.]|nr:hypothetical protein [Boseongicola sp.]NNL19003.1 hypothetical protein [Boseongicola sp.]
MRDLGMAVNMICRILVAFLVVIFLFGQVFIGIPEWFATAVGDGGFAPAGLTGGS